MRVILFAVCLSSIVFASPIDNRPIAQQLMAAIAININPAKVAAILNRCSQQGRKELISCKARFVTTVGANEPIVGVLSPKCILAIELKVAPYYLSSHRQKLYQIKDMFDFVEQG